MYILLLLLVSPFYNYYFSFILLSEFDKEEFSAAKVDPLYQFSKPVAVYPATIMLCVTTFFHHKANLINSRFNPI